MRVICFAAHHVHSHRLILFELHSSCFRILEPGLHGRELGGVLADCFSCGVRCMSDRLVQLSQFVLSPSHVRSRVGTHPRERNVALLQRLDELLRRFRVR